MSYYINLNNFNSSFRKVSPKSTLSKIEKDKSAPLFREISNGAMGLKFLFLITKRHEYPYNCQMHHHQKYLKFNRSF